MSDIYLLIEGQQTGPYSLEQVNQSLANGSVTGDLPAWRVGMAEWTPVQTLLASSSLDSGHCVIGSGVTQRQEASPSMAPVTKSRILSLENFKWMALGAGICGVIGVGIFLLIFGLSMVGNVFHGSPSDSIRTALRQDADLGSEYKKATSGISRQGLNDRGLDAYARQTNNLASAMRRVDISHCPREFQEAYRQHITCWARMANIVANHPHIRSGDEALLEGFLRGVGGDPTGGAFAVQDEYNSFVSQLREESLNLERSWDEVKLSAEKYGINTKDYSPG